LVLVLLAPLGCRSGAENLYDAAAGGYRTMAQRYLARGQDINATYTDGERTPLHAAAYNGHDEMVGFLIDRGAFVNPLDADGNTPLHLAAAAGHDGTVRALLREGADPEIRNQKGKRPIDLTVGSPEVQRDLRRVGG
jgi:ankyrin repeat protein